MALRLVWLVLLGMVWATPAWALAVYYVDPDWTGAQTGAPATPWTSLTASAWTTINAALASDDVTVYFSARQAGSDTSQTTTTELDVNRTNTSTHVLTLDGMSFYNTNDASPSWAAYFTPTPTNPGWNKSKFSISASSMLGNSDTSGTTCVSYVTLHGIKQDSTAGGGTFGYMPNLTIEYSEFMQSTGSGNVNVIVGPLNAGAGCGGAGVDNVTIRYNYIHNSYGECIYLGASSPGPPGPGNVSTGANYVIQGNRIEDCGIRPGGALAGGQGDGIDIKDGHINLQILNNVIRPRLSNPTGATDGQGITMESGALIDGNYVENPAHNGISIGSSWNNTIGRATLNVRNNIVVNVTSGVGTNGGIALFSSAQPWTVINIDNNSIYLTSDANIIVGSGTATTTTIQNNILLNGGGGISAGSGTLGTHDYNLFFNTGAASISYGGTFDCASVTSSEAHSNCADPKFVNTNTPYVDTNFKVQAGSPAIGNGFNLSGTFTNDYAGNTRTVPWDMGAWKFGAAGDTTPPAAPTGFRISSIAD